MTYSIQLSDRKEMIRRIVLIIGIAILVAIAFYLLSNTQFVFAAPGNPNSSTSTTDAGVAGSTAEKIRSVLKDMISVIGVIFQAVGVVLSVYSVGQLILAFKNEDADSKSRASTTLVVGIALIAMPAIVDALNLVEMVTGT